MILHLSKLQAKRNIRAAEVGSDTSKQYNQHLILISEVFTEGWMAVRRTAVTTNGAVPSGLSAAKLEPLMTTTSTVQSQPTALRPSAVSASKFVMQGDEVLTIMTLEYRLSFFSDVCS